MWCPIHHDEHANDTDHWFYALLVRNGKPVVEAYCLEQFFGKRVCAVCLWMLIATPNNFAQTATGVVSSTCVSCMAKRSAA